MALLLSLTHSLLLRKMAQALVFEKPVQTPDIIIVLAGDEGPRIAKSVQLYKDGISDRLMMAGGGKFLDGYYANYMKDYAIRLGAKKQDILVEKEALSTHENATFSLPIIQKYHFKSVLVVTSKYHTRRAYSVFNKLYTPVGIQVGIISAPDSIDYDNWWTNHDSCEAILIEWFKTGVYKLNELKGWN